MSRTASQTARRAPPPVSGAASALQPYSQAMTLALLRALEALMSRMRPILRAHGVTEQQWRVRRILSDLSEV